MPDARRRRRAARYDPLTARRPEKMISHSYATRAARIQAANVLAMPAEVLAHILSFVPWHTARQVCRAFATLRPVPRVALLQSQVTRAIARSVPIIADACRIRLLGHGNTAIARTSEAARETLRYRISKISEIMANCARLNSTTDLRYVLWSSARLGLERIFDCMNPPALYASCNYDLVPSFTNTLPIAEVIPLCDAKDCDSVRHGHITQHDRAILFELVKLVDGTFLSILDSLPGIFAEYPSDRTALHYPREATAALYAAAEAAIAHRDALRPSE